MVRRGEIWWVDFGDPIGSEPAYRRPAVVVQVDSINRSNIRTVIVATLTSSLKAAGARGNVAVTAHESGLSKDSVVNISQLYTVGKNTLEDIAGTLSEKKMREVDNGLRLILGL